jgi:hypothetical protein
MNKFIKQKDNNMYNKTIALLQRINHFFSIRFDRTLHGSATRQLAVLTLSFIILYLFWYTVILLIMKDSASLINKEIQSPEWSIIAQMIDPGNQHMIGTSDWKLRSLVLVISLSGTFVFSGLLISTLTNVFEQRVSKVREGLINYHFSGHTVILGYHDITKGIVLQLLLKQINKPGKIVILTEGNVPEIRKTLRSEVTKQQFKYLYILAGKRTSINDLNRCGVTRAVEIYIPGERGENDHDPKNNTALREISNIMQESACKQKNRIPCHVLFDSQTTHLLYQYGNIELNKDSISIQSFSYYESWAFKVFLENDNRFGYSPLDFEAINAGSEKYVHLIVAGMTRMGFALAVQAARLAHFANHLQQKTQITFIDAEAESERDFFASRYQSFYDAVDVEYVDLFTGETIRKNGRLPFINLSLKFVKGKFESQKVRELLLKATSDTNALTTIALTFLNPKVNMAGALYLPDEIYDRKVRILVQQDTKYSAVSLMIPDGKDATNKFRYVRAFGMLDECPGLVNPDDFKAKLVNHFYWSGNQLPVQFTAETFAKMQQQWDDLPERHKWSSRNNAQSIPIKLRAADLQKQPVEQLDEAFNPQLVEMLAQIEHARWNIDALLMGFQPPTPEVVAHSMSTADAITAAITAGESEVQVKSLEKVHTNYVKEIKKKMIHPCLVPYNQLSEYYKDIDRRLVRSIPTIEKFHAQQTKTF